MIRPGNRVSYAIPPNEPRVRDAKVLRVHVCNETAELVGWPHRTFPLKFLTKC